MMVKDREHVLALLINQDRVVEAWIKLFQLTQYRRLREIMPTVESRLLYLDHIARRGCDLFRVACDRDLEGIVAKWAHGTYQTDGRSPSWLKIKNAHYSQMEVPHELVAARRDSQRRQRSVVPPSLVLA